MEDLLQVGAITSTHGVRGEVKVFPTTDDVKRFSKLKEVELETPTGTTHICSPLLSPLYRYPVPSSPDHFRISVCQSRNLLHI